MYMEKHKVGHISPCSSIFFCVVLNFFNHLHTINYDIWLLSTTTTSFLHWLISVLLLHKIFTLEQTFFLLQASREVDDLGQRGRGLYIRNTASLIRALEYLQTL